MTIGCYLNSFLPSTTNTKYPSQQHTCQRKARELHVSKEVIDMDQQFLLPTTSPNATTSPDKPATNSPLRVQSPLRKLSPPPADLEKIYRSKKGRPILSNFPTSDFVGPSSWYREQHVPVTNNNTPRIQKSRIILAKPKPRPKASNSKGLPGARRALVPPQGSKEHPIDVNMDRDTVLSPGFIFYTTAAGIYAAPPRFPHRHLPLPVNTTRPRANRAYRVPQYSSLPTSFGARHVARGSSKGSMIGETSMDSALNGAMQHWQQRHFEKWSSFGGIMGGNRVDDWEERIELAPILVKEEAGGEDDGVLEVVMGDDEAGDMDEDGEEPDFVDHKVALSVPSRGVEAEGSRED